MGAISKVYLSGSAVSTVAFLAEVILRFSSQPTKKESTNGFRKICKLGSKIYEDVKQMPAGIL